MHLEEPQNITTVIVSDLVEQLRLRLNSGKTLPAERVFAEELNVTRYQLRRALAVLREQGELETPPPRKSSPSTIRAQEAIIRDTNPLEIIELRLLLEPGFARLAAFRATPQDIAQLQKACHTQPNADRLTTDESFHKLVATASGNTLIADFYSLLRKVSSDSRLRVSKPSAQHADRIKRRDSEHLAIVEAIADRDPDRAEEAMRQHLLCVQKQIMNRINPGSTIADEDAKNLGDV